MTPLRTSIRDHVHRLVRAGDMKIERPAGDSGLFGEGSEAWRVHADFSAMMIGGVASLFTQMLHPGALAGVWDHSDWERSPHGRLARTAQFVAVTTYGGTAQAEAAIARVRRIHDRVVGALPSGEPYAANDRALLTWVHAAEVDCFLRAHVAYREPGMPGARQDRYLGEMAALAEKMGAGEVPASRRALAAYFREMRPALRCDERTRAVAAALLKVGGADAEVNSASSNGADAPPAGLARVLTQLASDRASASVTGGIGQVVMQAGVEMMQPWAAAMHGMTMPALRRPGVRAGAGVAAGVLRWALRA